jgi:hypothetical protein
MVKSVSCLSSNPHSTQPLTPFTYHSISNSDIDFKFYTSSLMPKRGCFEDDSTVMNYNELAKAPGTDNETVLRATKRGMVRRKIGPLSY